MRVGVKDSPANFPEEKGLVSTTWRNGLQVDVDGQQSRVDRRPITRFGYECLDEGRFPDLAESKDPNRLIGYGMASEKLEGELATEESAADDRNLDIEQIATVHVPLKARTQRLFPLASTSCT